MSRASELATEFEQELQSTRRVIERVPDDNMDWKPHPKSFSIAHLTQLVSTMPDWITRTLRDPFIDLAANRSGGYRNQSTASLLEQLDALSREALDTLRRTTDEQFAEEWSLRMGDHVIMTMPKSTAVRQHINHWCHHRGQLTVYLRLLDVPVPQVYGPTADEKW